MRHWRYIGLLWLALALGGQSMGQVVEMDEKELRDTFSHYKANVLFFFIEDCPACQNLVHHVVEMRENYAEEEVSITGIFVSPEKEGAKLRGFQEDFSINFPTIHDSTTSVAASFGATTMPEVMVIDSNGKIRYQGALNNYYYALGRHRRRATAHYLKEALQSVLTGNPIETPYIEPIGCFIDFD